MPFGWLTFEHLGCPPEGYINMTPSRVEHPDPRRCLPDARILRRLCAGGGAIGIRRGVAMDSPKYQPGLPWPTLLCPAGGPPLKQPYGHFRGDLCIPHALRSWSCHGNTAMTLAPEFAVCVSFSSYVQTLCRSH
jgi:hypothetical protein